MEKTKEGYENKLQMYANQIFELENELTKAKSLSSHERAGSSQTEVFGASPDVAYDDNSSANYPMHKRSATPTGTPLNNLYEYSPQVDQNRVLRSSIGTTRDSVSNGLSKNSKPIWLENLSNSEYKTLRKYQRIIDNANRIE